MPARGRPLRTVALALGGVLVLTGSAAASPWDWWWRPPSPPEVRGALESTLQDRATLQPRYDAAVALLRQPTTGIPERAEAQKVVAEYEGLIRKLAELVRELNSAGNREEARRLGERRDEVVAGLRAALRRADAVRQAGADDLEQERAPLERLLRGAERADGEAEASPALVARLDAIERQAAPLTAVIDQRLMEIAEPLRAALAGAIAVEEPVITPKEVAAAWHALRSKASELTVMTDLDQIAATLPELPRLLEEAGRFHRTFASLQARHDHEVALRWAGEALERARTLVRATSVLDERPGMTPELRAAVGQLQALRAELAGLAAPSEDAWREPERAARLARLPMEVSAAATQVDRVVGEVWDAELERLSAAVTRGERAGLGDRAAAMLPELRRVRRARDAMARTLEENRPTRLLDLARAARGAEAVATAREAADERTRQDWQALIEQARTVGEPGDDLTMLAEGAQGLLDLQRRGLGNQDDTRAVLPEVMDVITARVGGGQVNADERPAVAAIEPADVQLDAAANGPAGSLRLEGTRRAGPPRVAAPWVVAPPAPAPAPVPVAAPVAAPWPSIADALNPAEPDGTWTSTAGSWTVPAIRPAGGLPPKLAEPDVVSPPVPGGWLPFPSPLGGILTQASAPGASE